MDFDIGTIFASGGIVTIVSAALVVVFERRVRKIEDEKVNKETFEVVNKNTREDIGELKTTTKETHDNVIKIMTKLDIKC